MTRSRVLLIAALSGVTLGFGATSLAEARPSANGPWVVKELGQGRAIIAGHRTRSGPQTLAALIRTWGRPASLSLRPRQGVCIAAWRRPAAKVSLRNYGGGPPGTTLCSPQVGRISVMDTVGNRWRTSRGLAVGAAESTITALHPTAFLAPNNISPPRTWGLAAYETIGYEGVPITVSGAYLNVRSGRVAGFRAVVGAEGE